MCEPPTSWVRCRQNLLSEGVPSILRDCIGSGGCALWPELVFSLASWNAYQFGAELSHKVRESQLRVQIDTAHGSAGHPALWSGAGRNFQAYKNIEMVIGLQAGVLVEVVAKMTPKVVIMGGMSDDGD